MDDQLIEELLNEDESPSLDFKRDQYPFDKATDDEKSEIIKDILAFANAWRRYDGYILIGVDEVKGGRSKVVGVINHLNESNLQQLVNSKTQIPVNFSYQAYEFERVQIGIITVPVQQRPIYLKKDFGKLKKEVVCIRRGSSTDEAKPDEVARMGVASTQVEKKIPILDLHFGDISTRKEFCSNVTLKSLILSPSFPVDLIKPKPKPKGHPLSLDFDYIDIFVNKDYYEELIYYVFLKNALNSMAFVIENKSDEVASGVQLKAIIGFRQGFRLLDENNSPKRPQRRIPGINPIHSLKHYLLSQPHPIIDTYSDHYELTIKFDDVLPGSKNWTTAPIYFGANIPQDINFDAFIYAKNLPEPIRMPLSVQIETETRPMELTDVEQFLDKD